MKSTYAPSRLGYYRNTCNFYINLILSISMSKSLWVAVADKGFCQGVQTIFSAQWHYLCTLWSPNWYGRPLQQYHRNTHQQCSSYALEKGMAPWTHPSPPGSATALLGPFHDWQVCAPTNTDRVYMAMECNRTINNNALTPLCFGDSVNIFYTSESD